MGPKWSFSDSRDEYAFSYMGDIFNDQSRTNVFCVILSKAPLQKLNIMILTKLLYKNLGERASVNDCVKN